MTQTIEQLQAKVAELAAEVERLKVDRAKKQKESVTIFDINCELRQQLVAEQLSNKLLREALEAVIKVHGYESGIPVEAISTKASTEALDKYVDEKVKEEMDECIELNDRLAKLLSETAVSLKGEEAALTRHSWHDLPVIALAKMVEISELTRQRDLAVEALNTSATSTRQRTSSGADVRL